MHATTPSVSPCIATPMRSAPVLHPDAYCILGHHGSERRSRYLTVVNKLVSQAMRTGGSDFDTARAQARAGQGL